VLPIGVVKELEIDANGVMTGQPYFDSSDDFAVSIYNKYENGTLNMFSIGAVPLEVSLEPEDLLPGQTGPTVTKSLLKEISAVDIGGNAEAYGVALYDENDNEIQLSDDLIQTLLPTGKTKNTDMKVTTISVVGLLPMLKLADTAGENDVIEAFKGLITLRDEQAQKIITLNDQLTTETGKLTTLQGKYNELEKKTGGDAIIALVDKAVNDRLITRKDGDNLIELADGKIESVKKFLEGKTPNPSIKTALESNTKPSVAEAELVKLREMNYDQLFEIDGAITKLQDGDPDRWKEIYQAKFPNAKVK
jgi:hypothetical protein